MSTYIICGLMVLLLVLALQLRLIIRIWSALRWTHPDVHDLGTVACSPRNRKNPLLPVAMNSATNARGNPGAATIPQREEQR